MIGRIVGSALERGIKRRHDKHPVAGAIIGTGALLAARRLLPKRFAALAATAAAAYLTKKWADKAEAGKKSPDSRGPTPPPANP